MTLIKIVSSPVILVGLVLPLSVFSEAQAGCSAHDHLCSYHAIGQVTTPAIEQQLGENASQGQFSETGLYVISAWQDNASNQSADLDLEVLLPEKALNEDPRSNQFLIPSYSDTGPYVIRSVGYPADGNPFAELDAEAPRHVGTDQYDITFMNNTARAIHSEDANGANIIRNEPAVRPCDYTKNCEFVQIKGNIPSGEYRGALTNYDYYNLSDPSTPYFVMGAYLSPDLEETGVIINRSHTNGAMVGKIDDPDQVSEHYVFDFYNRGFSHAKSDVAYDDFISSFYHETKYADPKVLTDGFFDYKVQDRYADRQTDAIRNTIDANANISQQNMGMISYQNNVYLGRDLISKTTTPDYQAYLDNLKAEALAKEEQSNNPLDDYCTGNLNDIECVSNTQPKTDISAGIDNDIVVSKTEVASANPTPMDNISNGVRTVSTVCSVVGWGAGAVTLGTTAVIGEGCSTGSDIIVTGVTGVRTVWNLGRTGWYKAWGDEAHAEIFWNKTKRLSGEFALDGSSTLIPVASSGMVKSGADNVSNLANGVRKVDNLSDVSKITSNKSEVIDLFQGNINHVNINGKVLENLAQSSKVKVFEGASKTDVMKFFENLTGQPLPPPRSIPGKGNVYVVDTPQGKFNLRSFESPQSTIKNGESWTIDIPSGFADKTKKLEIKFIK